MKIIYPEKFNHVPSHDDPRKTKWDYSEFAGQMQAAIPTTKGDILDVGSNICDHSIFFALNNPKDNIVAFEPITSLNDIAKKNIEDHKVMNITLREFALGEEKGTAEISISNEASSMMVEHFSGKETIAVERLDDLKGLKPKFIKLDVEGAEYMFFKGAEKTIEKFKPVFCYEPHPHYLETSKIVYTFNLLEKNGYYINDIIYDNVKEYILSTEKTVSSIKISDFLLKNKNKWAKVYKRSMMWQARDKYERADKVDRVKLKKNYKEFSYPSRSPKMWLIWSKLYLVFKGKR